VTARPGASWVLVIASARAIAELEPVGPPILRVARFEGEPTRAGL
jgi:hypothetical protein